MFLLKKKKKKKTHKVPQYWAYKLFNWSIYCGHGLVWDLACKMGTFRKLACGCGNM